MNLETITSYLPVVWLAYCCARDGLILLLRSSDVARHRLATKILLWRHQKMKNVNDIRADILAAMQAAAEPESGGLNKSADQVLADAIEGYLTASTATASKSAPKAKTIKEKGIALCHQAQGYSANLRPVSLMMKASLDELTPEQRAALDRLGYVINQGK